MTVIIFYHLTNTSSSTTAWGKGIAIFIGGGGGEKLLRVPLLHLVLSTQQDVDHGHLTMHIIILR